MISNCIKSVLFVPLLALASTGIVQAPASIFLSDTDSEPLLTNIFPYFEGRWLASQQYTPYFHCVLLASLSE